MTALLQLSTSSHPVRPNSHELEPQIRTLPTYPVILKLSAKKPVLFTARWTQPFRFVEPFAQNNNIETLRRRSQTILMLFIGMDRNVAKRDDTMIHTSSSYDTGSSGFDINKS